MDEIGVDYSYQHPMISCLKDEGFSFVVRYVSKGSPPKDITAVEKQMIVDAGLQIVIVYQDGTSDMLRGYNEGRSDATTALREIKRLDMPNDRPIYFALDVDPNRLSDRNWAQIGNYIRGAQEILTTRRVGVYGGYKAIEMLVPTIAKWGWQTYAWSQGRISRSAHLYQHRNGVRLCGGTVDLNRSLTEDFGQWPEEEDMGTVDNFSAHAQRQIDLVVQDAMRDAAGVTAKKPGHASAQFRARAKEGSTEATQEKFDHIERRLDIQSEKLDLILHRLNNIDGGQ